jgi:diaminopimelate decarboxylase
MTEFGRSLMARTAIALTRVEYVRPLAQSNQVFIHLGADFLLRKAYQPHYWHHELDVYSPKGELKSGNLRPAQIVGPLCFSGDVIEQEVLLPEIEVGDFLCVRDVGAYTYSMWSHHCSRRIPSIYLDEGLSLSLLRKADSYDSVIQFWNPQASQSKGARRGVAETALDF